MQLFSHHTSAKPILVPAVVEPLVVFVLAGSAIVEEREIGGSWQAVSVKAGDFFLTNTDEPYEMRWTTHECETFEVMHVYLGLSYINTAAKEYLGPISLPVVFKDVSGGQDETVRSMLHHLKHEVLEETEPSFLLIGGIVQALAVHLIRAYLCSSGRSRNPSALQAYKLRRVVGAMHQQLSQDFNLHFFAKVANLSEFHFSRLFKASTGFSPHRYFIRLRIKRAQHLLLQTNMSVIDISAEVGYSSPSHFSQVFRREVGVTPTDYRR
ncbi:helix-turn-helix domain-containing protein [Pseudomonas abietaniphila]